MPLPDMFWAAWPAHVLPIQATASTSLLHNSNLGRVKRWLLHRVLSRTKTPSTASTPRQAASAGAWDLQASRSLHLVAPQGALCAALGTAPPRGSFTQKSPDVGAAA